MVLTLYGGCCMYIYTYVLLCIHGHTSCNPNLFPYEPISRLMWSYLCIRRLYTFEGKYTYAKSICIWAYIAFNVVLALHCRRCTHIRRIYIFEGKYTYPKSISIWAYIAFHVVLRLHGRRCTHIRIYIFRGEYTYAPLYTYIYIYMSLFRHYCLFLYIVYTYIPIPLHSYSSTLYIHTYLVEDIQCTGIGMYVYTM